MNGNRREYFRLGLPIPLSGLLQVVEVNGIMVSLKPAKIFIFDLSTGGARIHSRIDFPNEHQLVLNISFTLLGEKMTLLALIKRKKEIRPHLCEYGIHFITDVGEQRKMTGHINTLAVRLRTTLTNHMKSCSFSTDEEIKEMYNY